MKRLICPPPLRRGDRVAIVSLSSGMLGENPHSVILGAQRLRQGTRHIRQTARRGKGSRFTGAI